MAKKRQVVEQEEFRLPGFTSLPEADAGKPCLVLGIDGEQKTGKTTLALSATPPVAVLDLDQGLKGLGRRLPHLKGVAVKSFGVGAWLDTRPDEAEAMWADVLTTFDAAVMGGVRSIVVDSGTIAYNLIRWAAFGKLAQVASHQYAAVYMEMDKLISRATAAGVNLIFTHQVKEKWEGGQSTGELVFAGYPNFPYKADALVQTYRTVDEDGPHYHIYVRDTRQAPMVVGRHFPSMSFPELAVMLYPGTKREDWE